MNYLLFLRVLAAIRGENYFEKNPVYLDEQR